MRQMWLIYTAVESELQLLHWGMDHMHDRLYWAREVKWEKVREGAREGGSLGVAGEEETME